MHVSSAEGEAKFWLAPQVSLAGIAGYSDQQLRQVQEIVEGRRNEIIEAWQRHFAH